MCDRSHLSRQQRRVARKRSPNELQMVALENAVGDGVDLFIVENGVKIARRGYPGTPEARTWVPLVEGVFVRDISADAIEIQHFGNIGPGSGH
jgi:hypothetical protein